MDIVLYFMKLEDKYWGLFLVALFVLYALYTAKGQAVTEAARDRVLFLVCYGLLTYLLFLCPLTWQLLTRASAQLESYYELSHIELAVPVLCVAIAVLYERAQAIGRHRAPLFVAGLFLILFFAGEFAYTALSPREEVETFFDEEQAQVYDLILEDALVRGLVQPAQAQTQVREYAGQVFLWGPSQLMAKSRVYQPVLCPVYGKDIADAPDSYADSLVTIYNGYKAYEDKDSLLINKDDQLGAIANSLHILPEVHCQYVIVFDPQSQGVDFDAVSIFESVGYTFVGETDTMQVFYFLPGETEA